MSRHRHSQENRVVAGVTPTKVRLQVEALRRRATPRKLLLLECAIVRHAPFDEEGRTVWELLPGQKWFEATLPLTEHDRENNWPYSGGVPLPLHHRLNGHQAIELFEAHADGAGRESLWTGGRYCRWAEYMAESDRFDPPDHRRRESEVAYGVADWLLLIPGAEQAGDARNVLDYYLVTYDGNYYCWAKYRPLHPMHHSFARELIADIFGPSPPLDRFEPAWRTASAVGLATALYESRDFAALPVLADALEEVGCDNADLLAHCRGGGRHARGCWAIDRVLGKE